MRRRTPRIGTRVSPAAGPRAVPRRPRARPPPSRARPARSLDGGEIDAELVRDLAHERRRLDTSARAVSWRPRLAAGLGRSATAGSASPSPITTSTAPTGATSPSATRIRATRPAAGEGISTVVLSVWISTSGSSSAISWPSTTSQRATSPSVRPSPRSGSLNSYATARRILRRAAPRHSRRSRADPLGETLVATGDKPSGSNAISATKSPAVKRTRAAERLVALPRLLDLEVGHRHQHIT